MNPANKIYRQGDVMLIQIDALPPGLKPVNPVNGRIVIAYGEATGHHHSFPHRGNVALFRDDGGGNMYAVVSATEDLEHQEHAVYWAAADFAITIGGQPRSFAKGDRMPVLLPADRAALSAAIIAKAPLRVTGEPVAPGIFKVPGQREYHPEALRRVED